MVFAETTQSRITNIYTHTHICVIHVRIADLCLYIFKFNFLNLKFNLILDMLFKAVYIGKGTETQCLLDTRIHFGLYQKILKI